MNSVQRLLKFIFVVVISVFFVGCSLFSGGPGEELPPPKEVNYLADYNPGFENVAEKDGQIVPEEWRYQQDSGYLVATSDVKRSGDYSLKLSPLPDSDKPGEWTLVNTERSVRDLPGGHRYEYSVWVRTDEPVGLAGVSANIYVPDESTKKLHNWLDDGNFTTNGEWEQIKLQFDVPENVDYVTLYLRGRGPGTVYYDDASLTIVE